MKRRIIVCVLLAAAVIGGNGARAGASGDGGQRGMWEAPWGAAGRMMPPPPPLAEIVGRMARRLGLTGDQQAKITAIFAAEEETAAPLMGKMGEYRKQMHDAAGAARFDEAAIRAIAAQQAQVGVELAVSRARAWNRVNALLTPEQRVRAEEFPLPRHGGEGPEGGCGCGRGPRHMPPPLCEGERGAGPGDDEDPGHDGKW